MLALLLFNDHFWKGVGPSLFTGKLSDVAVMIVLPLCFQAGVEWLSWLRGRFQPRRSTLVSGVFIAAGIMACINMWTPAAEAYRWGLAALQWPARAAGHFAHQTSIPSVQPVSLVMDPTDLWTIPFGIIPLWLGWARAAPLSASSISAEPSPALQQQPIRVPPP